MSDTDPRVKSPFTAYCRIPADVLRDIVQEDMGLYTWSLLQVTAALESEGGEWTGDELSISTLPQIESMSPLGALQYQECLERNATHYLVRISTTGMKPVRA